jgi:hypothetical protein
MVASDSALQQIRSLAERCDIVRKGRSLRRRILSHQLMRALRRFFVPALAIVAALVPAHSALAEFAPGKRTAEMSF